MGYGLRWVCDPKKAITSSLVHFRYHVIGTKQKPALVALTGDGLVIYGGNPSCLCAGLKQVDPRPQAPFPATSQEAPLVSEQN
jgi:hypothetical protein